jgi:hypothetical protein
LGQGAGRTAAAPPSKRGVKERVESLMNIEARTLAARLCLVDENSRVREPGRALDEDRSPLVPGFTVRTSQRRIRTRRARATRSIRTVVNPVAVRIRCGVAGNLAFQRDDQHIASLSACDKSLRFFSPAEKFIRILFPATCESPSVTPAHSSAFGPRCRLPLEPIRPDRGSAQVTV